MFVVVNIDKTDRNRPISQDVFQGLTKDIIQISSTPIFVRTYSLQRTFNCSIRRT
jgi:hypothetical protein